MDHLTVPIFVEIERHPKQSRTQETTGDTRKLHSFFGKSPGEITFFPNGTIKIHISDKQNPETSWTFCIHGGVLYALGETVRDKVIELETGAGNGTR